MVQQLLQIDGTTDEKGTKTGEIGIRVTPAVAMTETETDESQVGEMERKKNAIDTTGTKGTTKEAEMASASPRGKARGTFGRILNPERQGNRHNYKVCPRVLHLISHVNAMPRYPSSAILGPRFPKGIPLAN
jgi:hypothetical protein